MAYPSLCVVGFVFGVSVRPQQTAVAFEPRGKQRFLYRALESDSKLMLTAPGAGLAALRRRRVHGIPGGAERKASAEATVASKSFVSGRFRLIQAKKRSTTHRRGKTT